MLRLKHIRTSASIVSISIHNNAVSVTNNTSKNLYPPFWHLRNPKALYNNGSHPRPYASSC